MELIFSNLRFLMILCLLLSGQAPLRSLALNIGINYGQLGNNLLPPIQVTRLLQSIGIARVKLYDYNPNILTAFANSNIEISIGVPNGELANMSNTNQAQSWIKQNVQPFLPQTKITSIIVGNEVFAAGPDQTGTDSNLMAELLPAMQSMYQALQTLGLSNQVKITTAHALNVLGSSFPPSQGSFTQNLAVYIQPMLDFLSQINSPFLINAYPFFAYTASPGSIPLPYVLFEPNQGVVDPVTNLTYDNMLYAQIDAVYAAMKAMGHTNIPVQISETGWPSKGDSDEPGATVENAGSYNRNLMKRIAMNQGTPLKPDVPVDVHVFALFNEDLKPGATSERNYGLFYPDGSPVYNLGLQGDGGVTTYSAGSPSSKLMIETSVVVLIWTMAFMV